MLAPTLALALTVAAATPAVADEGPVIVGYVFPQERVLGADEIDATKLTHVNYAFANIREGLMVEGFSRDAENFRVLAGLRARHPHLRVLVSVGGWTWSKGFSDVALTPESRRRFALSAVEFVRRHDLDGLDVDWEYPGLPGDGNPHRPEDKANFTALLSELRKHLDEATAPGARRSLLTIAGGAFPDYLGHTEMDKVQEHLDLVNLMTYDFRVPGAEPVSGHHANLRLHAADTNQLSADRAVNDFLAAGVPARKLVLGVPFYGRAWVVEPGPGDGAGAGLYRPGRAPEPPFPADYTDLAPLVGREGFARFWDETAQAPYLWQAEKSLFVAYDDPESLGLKCRYVRERGLRGVMFWEYSADATGALLGALFEELRGPGPDTR
jgi:chitinase